MADGLTHDHLNALGDRLEQSVRREVDKLSESVKDNFRAVHARVGEVNETVKVQNGRIGKSEQAIGAVKEDVRVLKHDFSNHLHKHDIAAALPRVVGGEHKLNAGFVAGVSAVIVALTGIAHGLWDVVAPLIMAYLQAKP